MKKVNFDYKAVLDFPAPKKGKRAYYYDIAIPGFGVSVTDKGTKTFFFYRKLNGVPKRITLGHFPEMSVEEARLKAEETSSLTQDGVLPDAEKFVASDISVQRTHKTVFFKTAFAAIIMFIMAGFGVSEYWQSNNALQSAISFAIDDHLNHKQVDFHSDNPSEIRNFLEQQLSYKVAIPQISPDFRVVGGRAQKIGANSVAYTLWNAKNDNKYSLFQFRREDFGVDGSDTPKLIKPQNMAVSRTPCEVLYWSRGNYGFILVADHGELLDGVWPNFSAIQKEES